MNIEEIKIIITIISGLIAIISIMKALLEYSKKNQLDRAKVYIELRKRFKETDNFATIISYLDSGDKRLATIDISDKLKFLGFLEEVALMVNSGLLNKKIANQSFGFYIRRAWENQYMWWEGNHKDSEYRILLHWLYNECVKIHQTKRSKKIIHYKF
jgi:hypothetical protein